MQTRQEFTLDGLRAVQQFLVTNEARLGPVADSGARRRLDRVVEELAVHASTQVIGLAEGQMATQSHHATRSKLLRDHMAAIVAIARLERENEPELRAIRMPRGNSSNGQLVAHAREMATMASAHTALFTAAGLASTFAEDLLDVARELADSRVRRSERRAMVSGATSGIRASLAAGRKLVAVLDSLIHRAGKNEPQLLMAWEAVKQAHHLGRPAPMPMLGRGVSQPLLASPDTRPELSAGEGSVANLTEDSPVP